MSELMTIQRRNPAPAAAEKPRQFLAFVLGGETFAMEIRSIKEVIQYGALTQVPMMPDFIRGVINLRGSVVPVIDLAVRFGRPPSEVSRRTCVVVLEVEHHDEDLVLGFIVDQVRAVLDIGASDIEPPPAFGSALRSEFLAGIGKVDGEFVILLDVDHVLSLDELSAISA
ncbi:chemotaxis protein CheW [Geothrix sp. 21YS21S-2]|uniref:chemotaxis protein CheW n=1 Tax=Geothrix sp. 21YS21S-2 TaxID=3068893 RepID=UPI0027B98F21|nr:chemotaxis protein CheW [Geothrix sp. 21YS21S-2]